MTKTLAKTWDAPERFTDSFAGLSRDALKSEADKHRWFHDFEFGDYRTRSVVYPEHMPANYHLLPIFHLLEQSRLQDARVLDIGTYDGLTALSAAAAGAARVDATCQFDLDRFRIARALSGVRNLAYFPGYDLRAIEAEAPREAYDIVIASAMMHHLTSPLDLFLLARQLLKRGGELIVESLIVPDCSTGLTLNTLRDKPVYGAPTLWLPSVAALEGMLDLACFDLAETLKLTGGRTLREPNYDRLTIRARAGAPKPDAANAKLAEFHGKLDSYGGLDLAALRKESRAEPVAPARHSLFSIWHDRARAPLHPEDPPKSPPSPSSLRAASVTDFQGLKTRHPEGEITWSDVSLLALNYPGEQMPEGMAWGLKQCGYLFVLDTIERLGLKRVLELGTGFNAYLENKLDPLIELDSVDSPGFYKPEVFDAIRAAPRRGQYFEGLLGQTDAITEGEYDACVSVSALEHVPDTEIDTVARHLFDVVRPGGWSIHSIDARIGRYDAVAQRWHSALTSAGFRLPDSQTTGLLDAAMEDGGPLLESNSVLFRFHFGYQPDKWGRGLARPKVETSGTLLVCAHRPLD
jgi:2-polyprenyl-3-methyl-5-hydroxy-6-metoxy-1,4-benzoquinol methylase